MESALREAPARARAAGGNPGLLRRRVRARPRRRGAPRQSFARSGWWNCTPRPNTRSAFVGFATCFPYLSGLPPALATPRLPAPRKRVPAGSVAIGGSQAGIYPLASPGGWRLIGRTPLPPVRSPRRAAGPAPHGRPRALRGRGREPLLNRLHVLAAGMQTTVQDLGRFGWAHHGVSASGAADALALRAGNLLVGNAENAAALEMTLVGGGVRLRRARRDRPHRIGFRRRSAVVERRSRSSPARPCAAAPHARARAATWRCAAASRRRRSWAAHRFT